MGFCDSSQSTKAPPVWADPLGPSSLGRGGVAQYGTSGAPQIRSGLFNQMQAMSPYTTGAATSLASRLPGDVNAPGWQAGTDLASRTMGGSYLNGSPQLDRAMAANRAGTLASAADQTARIQSQFGKSGMGWSTANQQAAQGNMAAAGAEAGRTNANTYAQNYAMERANQNAAPQAYAASKAAPFNYLSNATGAVNSPLSAQGNLLSALSSGGQVVTPNSTQSINPSLGSSIMNGFSGVMGSL